MVRVRRDPVGWCIYCGLKGEDVKLGDEHILAYSLGGDDVLPKASCKSCEAVTSALELKISRTAFGLVRAQLNLPTRNPRNRKKTETLRGETSDGLEVMVELPVENIPKHFVMPTFVEPGYWKDRERFDGIKGWAGLLFHGEAKAGDTPESVTHVQLQPPALEPVAFARVLAKTAHALAVASYGANAFRPFLPPVILGENADVGRYVGSTQDRIFEPLEVGTHRLALADNGSTIIAFIKLFACWNDAPTHEVVVGRLKSR